MQYSSGSFKLNGLFNLTERGLVLVGDLLDGEINQGDYLILPADSGIRLLKIESVEYTDHLQTHNTKLGLMIGHSSESLIECVSAWLGQDLIITKRLDF
jgi:hypothetical protein